MTTLFVLAGAGLFGASGLVARCARRAGPARADVIAVAVLSAGAASALVGAILALAGAGDELGLVGLDALSALFVVPVAVLGAACAVYSLAYFRAAEHPRDAERLRISFGLTGGGLLLVLLARHSLVFLASWEVMAIAAFFAVAAEDRDASVREAGFLYLVSTRVSALCLLALFALHWAATGSLYLTPIGSGRVAPGVESALFMLALAGFGLKAGLMPLHVWLPPAHAAAPTHVSALLSGVLIKSGIYGIARVTSLLPDAQAWWGELLLVVGIVSAVLGVAYALAQHDVKRLLAYHSVENIGIIAIGLGVALIARSAGHFEVAALAMAGALLHVVNHALFKGLLFLGAGAVIQRTGTRSLDALGGIAKEMPATASFFLIGAVAIVGLPPLNGFVSELLVYSALLRVVSEGSAGSWLPAALAVPSLALTGGLALACFAKVVGAVFLGAPRHRLVSSVKDAPREMLAPMGALASLCALIGVAPGAFVAALGAASAVAQGASQPASLHAPLAAVSALAIGVLLPCGALGLLLRSHLARAPLASAGTWDCGYASPDARMQYSASSFADPLVKVLAFALAPRVRAPRLEALFPGAASFHTEIDDAALDRLVVPATRGLADWLGRLRVLQRGSVQAYLLYVWLALLVLLGVSGVTR